MKGIQPVAIYVLWLRTIKRLLRSKAQIVGNLMMPFFFLLFLGAGFSRTSLPGVPQGVRYISYLVPGILGMSILFSSTFAGLSVLWDREFGFLKEIMVAPVSRLSIVLGRIAGGVTTTLVQVFLIFGISLILGFRVISLPLLLLALLFAILTSATFIGLGLIFASNMRDMQGFNVIMSFVMFPLLFLSGAIFPMKNLPVAVRALAYIDPLTYGVDGLRAALIQHSALALPADLLIMIGFSLLTVTLGAYFFEKSESV